METLRILIPSRLVEVAPAARAIRHYLLAAGRDELEAAQVELCAAEAANNAIRHAYGGRDGHVVEIVCGADATSIRLEVSDEGRTMPGPPVRRPPQVDPADIESLPEGGMGLYMIGAIMDEVTYTTRSGRNTLHMTRHASVPEPEPAGSAA